MFGRNTVRLVVLLCCCLSVLILKSCSLPNRPNIHSVISPNFSFNTAALVLKSKIYYINGLATEIRDAEDNRDRIIAAIGGNEENVLIRLKDNIGFEQDIANYRLAYSMALGGITASGNVTQAADNPTFQIVASIALKIREALPELSDPQAWQYTRVLLKAPNANDILRPLLQRFNVQETLINLLGQTIRDRIEEPNPDPTTGFVPENPGEDPSPDMIPVDELDRLFPNLPPDPGEAGKQTLEGIDADGDGVRDDVQRWIYRRYPNDELKRKAMLRYAKALQASIVNVDRDSRDQVRARVLDGFRAERCARLAFGGVDQFDLIDEVAEAVREVQFQMLNTQERVIADLTVDAKFSGQVVGAEESTCTDPIR
jgi:hypothetical protein